MMVIVVKAFIPNVYNHFQYATEIGHFFYPFTLLTLLQSFDTQ